MKKEAEKLQAETIARNRQAEQDKIAQEALDVAAQAQLRLGGSQLAKDILA